MIGLTGYTDTQIARAHLAAVAFLAADPGRIERSLRMHRDDGRGRCTECRMSGGPWPCVLYRLTQAAIERLESIPGPRGRTP